MPTLEGATKDVIRLAKKMAEEQYRIKNDKIKTWRGKKIIPAQEWSNPNTVVARAGEFGERPHAHGRSKDLHAKRIREASPPRYAALSSGADRTHFHNRQTNTTRLTARHKVLQPRYHCRGRKRGVERLRGGEGCFVSALALS